MNLFEITKEMLYSLHGDEFEEIIKQYYETLGYECAATPVTNDYGADLVVSTPSGNICIQCKRQTSNVNIKAIQEVYASIQKYAANAGIVITTSSYTSSALELAKCCGIKIIDGEELWTMITNIQNDEFIIKEKVNLKNEMTDFLRNKNEYIKYRDELQVNYETLNQSLRSYEVNKSNAEIIYKKISDIYNDFKVVLDVNNNVLEELSNKHKEFNKSNNSFDERFNYFSEKLRDELRLCRKICYVTAFISIASIMLHYFK